MISFPIVSYQREVFQEYLDEISLMLFSRGCNLNCVYCFNKHGMCKEPIGEAIDLIKELITPMHTAVVISGGEPTIHSRGLEETLRFIKENMKLKTKLFSNGVNVLILKSLIEKGLLDAISLDFKIASGVQEYTQAKTYVYDDTYIGNLNYLINLCKARGLPLDIRTVLHPSVNYLEIDKYLDGFCAKSDSLITIYKEKYIPIGV